METLNHVHTGKLDYEEPLVAPVASQAAAMEQIISASQRIEPPADLRPDGALRALLGSTAYYHAVETTRAPFSEAIVSWPEEGKPEDIRPSSLRLPAKSYNRAAVLCLVTLIV